MSNTNPISGAADMQPPSREAEALAITLLAAPARAHVHQAAMLCERARRDAEEAAFHVNASIGNARNILPLLSPIRWLPVTPDLLALLGETSKADYVLIQNPAAHLVERRPAEAAEISEALRQSGAELLFHGQRYAGTRRYELVVRSPDKLGLFLPIKFLTADINGVPTDQCIASTAHKIDAAEICRLVRRGRLKPVGR